MGQSFGLNALAAIAAVDDDSATWRKFNSRSQSRIGQCHVVAVRGGQNKA